MEELAALGQVTYPATGSVGAKLEKLLIPIQAGLIVGAGRGDTIITLACERIDVLHPETKSILRGHVGLARLIGSREE